MDEGSDTYDAIVIGAGVEGSSTAYNIASKGAKRVALLEQFLVGHTRGSSHGGSRITRRGYHTKYYAEMMTEAFRMWEEIERETSTQLYIKTGGIHFGVETSKSLKDVIDGFAALGVKHEVLSSEEANKRFEFFQLPANHICALEEDAGILAAGKAVNAIQSLFTRRGGKIFDNCQVQEIRPGNTVTVVTRQAEFKTKKLIITAGPWSSKLLKPLGVDLPLKVMKIDVMYWKTDRPDICTAGCGGPGAMGVFIECDCSDDIDYYGLPSYEYPGLVKIGRHDGPVVDPDHRDAEPGPRSVQLVAQLIDKHFKGISNTPSIVESCLYTMTPDHDFFLDYHPQHHNIIIGAGFSGHGFKLAPVVGKILSEMALDQPPSYDLLPFKLDRFNKP